MDYKIAMDWANYLEKPELKQAKGVLRNGEGRCCLGHLCDMLQIPAEELWLHAVAYDGETHTYAGEIHFLPDFVMQKSGIFTKEGLFRNGYIEFEGTSWNGLSQLNDRGVPLSSIAKIIREQWENL